MNQRETLAYIHPLDLPLIWTLVESYDTWNVYTEEKWFCLLDAGYINISDAAKVGDIETIKTALQQGTDVDQRDKYYKTPLMSACLHGNIAMAKYLLIAG